MNPKIKIVRTGNSGGPNHFLSRLEQEFKSKGITISDNNPAFVLSTKNVETSSNFALRLDGLDHEDHSFQTVKNKIFYRYNSYKKLFRMNNIIHKYFPILYRNFFRRVLNFFFFNKHNREQIKGYENADLIIYQSKFSKNYFETFLGKPKKPNFIIYNGVDLNIFNPNIQIGKKVKNIMKADFKIITSCSFRIHKRLHESLKLFKFVLKKIPTAKYFVMGHIDKQTKEIVDRIISFYEIEKNVVLLGKIPVSLIPEYYAEADIMLYPSWLDPCPNSVVECLASGTPVICPDSGGVKELVRKGGIVVPEKKIPKIDFTPYYCLSEIPEINYKVYLNSVLKIQKNINEYSKKARSVAEENLDIVQVSKKYLDAFNQITNV